MKNKLIIIAIIAVIGLSFSACGGDDDGGGKDPVIHTVTFNANGGTVEGATTKDVKVEDGKKVTLPTDPVKTSNPNIFWGWFDNKTGPDYGNIFTGTMPVTADKTVYARWGGTEPPQQFDVTFNVNGGKFADGGTTLVIPVYQGEKVTPPFIINGDYMVSGWYSNTSGTGTAFTKDTPITANLTLYAQWKKPEQMPDKDRWDIYRDSNSSATLNNSSIVANGDGSCVVTVSVGGTPDSNNNEDGWYAWRITAEYYYSGITDKMYAYTFQAWTDSGTRELYAQYYEDNNDKVYLNEIKSITTEQTTYTIYGRALPKGGLRKISFQCADQLGTVHIKMLNIKEYTRTKLTITGIGSKYGHWVEPAEIIDINWNRIAFDPATSVADNGTLTLYFWDYEDQEKYWDKAGNYFIVIWLWGKDENTDGPYIYTGGKNFDSDNMAQYTYSFAKGGQHTINFNQFKYLEYMEDTVDPNTPGDDGVPKTLVITDITGVSGQITAGVIPNQGQASMVVAINQVAFSPTVTIPLISTNPDRPFTGTGSFYIYLFFDVHNTPDNLEDDTIYYYVTNLTEATTVIPFNSFIGTMQP